ncbi:nitroreductase family protein [Clostridium oryzae]|uniref:FMN reductase n=1 Tax=Clostridium oryzae TaxID=1450648 RepID=A0A1V4IVM5_9CLOT|nr:nitroreductase family protein [Clostridium oryzae]OPJ63949.1 FMN reductase [Clostridium oryzae]
MIKEIETRRSVRKYLNKPIEDEKITEIIESARLAPSGNNSQPWSFIIVKSEEMRQKVVKVSHDQKWMLDAPVLIVCVADIRCRITDDRDVHIDENSPEEEVKLIIRDTAIAIEHILLQAKNLGLGTCWVGWFIQNEIRQVLDIPDDKYVVGVIPVGYANEAPNARPRRGLDEIVHYEKW